MGKAAEFYQGLNESVRNAIDRVSPFRAVAHDVVDGKIQIQELGSDTPLDEPFARLEGFDIDAGDEVAVIMLSGQPFVLGKIQRSAGAGQEVSDALIVSTEKNNALRIEKPDGTGIFEVDSLAPSQVRVTNNVHLAGYNNSGSGTPIWNIDSSNGSARFDGDLIVGGEYVAPPIIKNGFQAGAGFYTTTNTATPATIMSQSFTLPSGTWSAYMIGGARFKNSASSLVRMELNIHGDMSGMQDAQADADEWSPFTITHAAEGLSGFQNYTLRYLSSGTSTTTLHNWWFQIIYIRTA